MNDVPQDAKIFIDRATFLRGSIVQSFAQMEYMLGDLGHQAATLPEYSDFAGFRRPVDSRIAMALEIAAAAGPFGPYRTGIEGICSTLKAIEPFRNFLTHGWLEVRSAPAGVLPKYHLQFRKWDPAKPNRPLYLRVDMDWLTELADRAMAGAVISQALFREIYQGVGLQDPLFENYDGDTLKLPLF
ncbi:hypothetical protein [Brevundimonas sp.]|uniref:hypothetical protein n=1 Tax=Brevundimonas sp. TaxID=1871086 RepID=UPI00289C55E8|nr:hypothetical protein [Brevundimonas sp.]